MSACIYNKHLRLDKIHQLPQPLRSSSCNFALFKIYIFIFEQLLSLWSHTQNCGNGDTLEALCALIIKIKVLLHVPSDTILGPLKMHYCYYFLALIIFITRVVIDPLE